VYTTPDYGITRPSTTLVTSKVIQGHMNNAVKCRLSDKYGLVNQERTAVKSSNLTRQLPDLYTDYLPLLQF